MRGQPCAERERPKKGAAMNRLWQRRTSSSPRCRFDIDKRQPGALYGPAVTPGAPLIRRTAPISPT
jgi:hypothetical protein